MIRRDQTPVVQRFVQDVGSAAWNSTSLEELATSGRRVKLEGLVTGRVLLPEDGTPPSLQLRVFDLRPGGTMRELSFPGRELSAKEVRAVASGGSDFSFGWFVLAVLVILALPWLTPFCTEWAVGRKSNGASALLLMGYVAADVLVLGLVPGLGARLSGGLILPALAAALCAGYSHWACETVAARRR
jgi:hypothetical protein